jgi:predicted ATP-grasp superfamily ATP-dependent carboligase
VTSVDRHPEVAQPGWPPAVIAGAFQTGVLGVRTLRRRGVEAVCFDANPRQSGFRSSWGPARLCPSPDNEPDAWVRFMVELAATFRQRPVLISSSDQFVSAIARHADALAPHYVLSPGCRLQGLLADKQTQYDLSARHGMPMPRTEYVEDDQAAARFAGEARFPCVVKPTHFRQWQKFPAGHPLSYQKVAVVKDAAALLATYRMAAEVTPRVILQEVIQGADTNKRVYLACYDTSGARIAHAMFRELRCDPVGFGPASISEPVVDPETDRVCDDFLRSIGYVGICEIEMKWDDRDGAVRLIEANPRLSGGGDAAPYAGVDLCWIHYLDLIGQRVTPVAPNGRDFRHIVVRADGRALPAYWRAGLLGWKDVARSYRPPLAFFDLDRRDLRASLETLYVFGRTFISEVLRKER